MDHAFTDIEIKANACEMIDQELAKKRSKFMISTGAMSDPYMNIPEVLNLSRCAFEKIFQHGFGLSFQTKSTLFLRDLDLLKKINDKTKCVVQMTLTTADDELCKIIEPGVDITSKRVEALNQLLQNGIPTVVWISPILPMINDTIENVREILNACLSVKVKGIVWFGAGVTLRDGDRQYFYKKLDQHFPGLKEKYIHKYGNDYEIYSDNHQAINQLVVSFCKKHEIIYMPEDVFKYISEFPIKRSEQLSLF